MATPFEFEVVSEPGTKVLVLMGELDVASPDLDELALAIQDSDRTVVVDMGGITFIDSTGLGLLVGFQKLVNQRGLAFALRHPTRRVEQLMQMTGLDRVLGVETPAA